MSVAPGDIPAVLDALRRGGTLDQPAAEGVFSALLAGGMTTEQIVDLLTLIQARGATVDELVGAGRVMRRHVTSVPIPPIPGAAVLDTCGTGGTPKTFNISTAAAIVAAAAAPGRLLVAKHGNRSRSGRGSAEVLRTLGVNIDASPAVQGRCLKECGLCFCFAVHHHPAMRFAAPARQAIGTPTIFNLLGPLTNPAGADRQVMGVLAERYVEPMAQALAQLGSTHAIVVHSRDGMDEISLSAPTLFAEVHGRAVTLREFDPSSLGLRRCQLSDLAANDLESAAAAMRGVLSNEPGPKRAIVALNAAAALVVGGVTSSWEDALMHAEDAIASGMAARTFETLARVSNEPIASA